MWLRKQKFVLLSLAIISTLITGCCGDIKAGKQTVDVSPLYELQLQLDNVQKLPEIIDTNVFDYLETAEDYALAGSIYGNGRVSVSMYLESDAQVARREFLSECKYIPQVTNGGSGDNQYCMSQVVELRSSAESLCRPTGEYSSKVVFLKDRLIISLVRYTGDAESPELEEAILKLAQLLGK